MNSAFTQKIFWFCIPVFILMNGCSGTNQPSTTPSASLPLSSISPTVSSTSTSTPVELTPTSTAAAIAISLISIQDKAAFVSENYPDNSVLKPGEAFVKTWEIKNTGSLTWTTAYQFVLSASPQGDTLSAPSLINFSQEASPGKTLSLSLPLTAPATRGTYTAYWSIKNERGEIVAVDGSNLWVKIQVCEPGQACNAPAAGGGTTVSGITVGLTSFTNDAQSATVDFCMSVSFHKYTLDIAPSLLIDQKPAPFLMGSTRILRRLNSQKRGFLNFPTFDVKMSHLSLYFINIHQNSLLFTHFG